MTRIGFIAFFAFFFVVGGVINANAQTWGDRKVARKMARAEHKETRKTKKRPEQTAAFEAAYGTPPGPANYNSKRMGPKIKVKRRPKPAKGTHSKSITRMLKGKNG